MKKVMHQKELEDIKTKKGIQYWLLYLIKLLKRNTIASYLGIIATIIVGLIPFIHSLQGEKKEIKVFLGDFEIKNERSIPVLFLLPTSKISSNINSIPLPIKLHNCLQNNIENFQFDIRHVLEEKAYNKPQIMIPNSSIQITHKVEYKQPRFRKNYEIVSGKRQAFIWNDWAVVRHEFSEFNSLSDVIFCEEIGLDLTWQHDHIKQEDGKSTVFDLFKLYLSYSYKNMLEKYESELNIAIINLDGISSLIDFVNENGSLPFYLNKLDPKSGENLALNKWFVIVPTILYDIDSKKYILDQKNIKVYEVRYYCDEYYDNRYMIIDDGEAQRRIPFDDINHSLLRRNNIDRYVDEASFCENDF